MKKYALLFAVLFVGCHQNEAELEASQSRGECVSRRRQAWRSTMNRYSLTCIALLAACQQNRAELDSLAMQYDRILIETQHEADVLPRVRRGLAEFPELKSAIDARLQAAGPSAPEPLPALPAVGPFESGHEERRRREIADTQRRILELRARLGDADRKFARHEELENVMKLIIDAEAKAAAEK